MNDWLAGFGQQPRSLPPARAGAPVPPLPQTAASVPPRAAKVWRKGVSRTLMEVACCPECGSARVKIRTNRGKIVLMECVACGHKWKDERCPRLSWGNDPQKRGCVN